MRRAQHIQEPVPARARCAWCGRPRPPLAKRDGDPYCNTECARRAHGVLAESDPDARAAARALVRAT